MSLKDKCTVVITSYNRWSLLKQTVNSLRNLLKEDINIVIVEDSVNINMKNNIIKEWGSDVHLIFNDQNIGQPASIDKGYSYVKNNFYTDYILHCEDDYNFIGNSNFIYDAISILENVSFVHNIWLRHFENYKVSHGNGCLNDLFEPNLLKTNSGVEYKLLRELHCGDWSGFTFMPHVKRFKDYLTMFPNGYSDQNILKGNTGVFAEKACSDYSRDNFKLRAAQLVNGCCNNVGQNLTTHKNPVNNL